MHLRAGGYDVAQQRLGALEVDGKIIVDEKNRHLSLLFASAGLQQEQFIHYALIGAEANRVSEKSGHGAELAAVRAASPGFDRNNAKCSPAFRDSLEQGACGLRHQIELLEIDRLPRNHRVFL